MMVWTWVTFLLMTLILYKVAWKPILAALERRENALRKTQEDAAQMRAEMAKFEEKTQQMIAEADGQAKAVVASARQAATELAQGIEEKARKDSQLRIEAARQEIEGAREKAVAAIRKEGIDVAIAVAGKLIEENLDDAKNRALADRWIKRI